jgi:hypothetical protein
MFFSFLKIITLQAYWDIIINLYGEKQVVYCFQVNTSYTLQVKEI